MMASQPHGGTFDQAEKQRLVEEFARDGRYQAARQAGDRAFANRNYGKTIVVLLQRITQAEWNKWRAA